MLFKISFKFETLTGVNIFRINIMLQSQRLEESRLGKR